MTNIERFQLASRETVPDGQMYTYRTTMASIWFPNDPGAQRDYVERPGQAPMGNATESFCLIDSNKVIGTAAIYSFSNIQHKEQLTNAEKLNNLPAWLTQTVYRGDLSIIPEFQGQGLAPQLIDKMHGKAFSESRNTSPNSLIGITEETNENMIRVVSRTGGKIVLPEDGLFIKFANDVRPRYLNETQRFSVTPLYLDENFPPVIHLFYDNKNDLQAATIATSPNIPGVTSAQSTGGLDDLFPNQCIGFINPELSRRKVRMLLPTIYNSVSRYKYVNLFQLREHTGNLSGNKFLRNGFSDGWVLYKYDKVN